MRKWEELSISSYDGLATTKWPTRWMIIHGAKSRFTLELHVGPCKRSVAGHLSAIWHNRVAKHGSESSRLGKFTPFFFLARFSTSSPSVVEQSTILFFTSRARVLSWRLLAPTRITRKSERELKRSSNIFDSVFLGFTISEGTITKRDLLRRRERERLEMHHWMFDGVFKWLPTELNAVFLELMLSSEQKKS